MLSFVAGLVIFLSALMAKWALASVVLTKKRVLLKLMLLVFSELFVVFGLYLAIKTLNLETMKILIGFAAGLVTSIFYYVISFYLENKG